MVGNAQVERLLRVCDPVVVCPEEALGLGTPREKIRVVSERGEERLIQPASGLDLSGAMRVFCAQLVGSSGALDGAVLKGRSPSCGLNNTLLMADRDTDRELGITSGLFAAELCRRLPALAVISEDQLADPVRFETFASRISRAAAERCRTSTGGGS